MAFERAAGAIGFSIRVDAPHSSRDLTPVSALRISIEKAHVSDRVFVVIGCQAQLSESDISNIGI
jgi:hypothetical protein